MKKIKKQLKKKLKFIEETFDWLEDDLLEKHQEWIDIKKRLDVIENFVDFYKNQDVYDRLKLNEEKLSNAINRILALEKKKGK